MDDDDTKDKTLTIPRASGKTLFVVVVLMVCFLVIFALRKGHLLGLTATIVAAAICSVVWLLGLLSSEVCVFTSHPRSMRIERWIVDVRVHAKLIDIDAVRWIRSRWTIQGITLELGVENSWDTIEVQTTYMSAQEFALSRGEQESRVNELRVSIAQFLNIKDAGWEKYPTQRASP
ncbi:MULTISPECIES: hypothetical protein [unclassified Paraburkholderia]|uniref:hypothetical protein n=1 Tax=unclassified Paraburkholderia TaxID=2615204 RepID=UPI002AB31281|nr:MULTISPECIES: hypothetical protein [unclassified Paraburkholderia]